MSRLLPSLARRFILCPQKSVLAGPGRLLIDDSDANCMDWREAGGDAILLPRLWNSRHAERAIAADVLKNELARRK